MDADRYIEDLKDANSTIRLNAVDALGKIKDPRAVDPLIASLKDENYNIQQATAIALGNISGDSYNPTGGMQGG